MPNKKQIETTEELEMIHAIERGEFESLNEKELDTFSKLLTSAAHNTIEKLSKRKAISIRLLEDDIDKLKAMALNDGMPYQTYITHIIHKITTGQVRVS